MIPSTAPEPSMVSISSDSEQDRVPPSKLPANSTKLFIGKALRQKPKPKYINEEDSDDRAFINDSALNKETPEERLVY